VVAADQRVEGLRVAVAGAHDELEVFELPLTLLRGLERSSRLDWHGVSLTERQAS
jgi:hypothetical protein